MKIGIDARLYGPEHTGLGRYVTNLVDNLLKLDKQNFYVLFVNSKHQGDFQQSIKLKVVLVDIPIYGFLEQLVLPFIFSKEKLDLLHVPHFNAPLLYPGKFVITLHDLIKHASKGPATTTRPHWQHQIIRLAYHLETFIVSLRARAFIVPTEYVKNDIIKHLRIPDSKVFVTYESFDKKIKKTKLPVSEANELLNKYDITQPFLVYTGNLYPHKNVDLLMEAVVEHNKKKEVDLCLAISCARSVFYSRAEEKIRQLGGEKYIKLLGFVDDTELGKLYSLALCLVHPSKMEGFGLTGLEAMGVGLPVVAARSSCLPEVYGSACLYFNPDSLQSLIEAIEKIIKDVDLRVHLSLLGQKQVKKYSWTKMAKQTQNIYQSFESK